MYCAKFETSIALNWYTFLVTTERKRCKYRIEYRMQKRRKQRKTRMTERRHKRRRLKDTERAYKHTFMLQQQTCKAPWVFSFLHFSDPSHCSAKWFLLLLPAPIVLRGKGWEKVQKVVLLIFTYIVYFWVPQEFQFSEAWCHKMSRHQRSQEVSLYQFTWASKS